MQAGCVNVPGSYECRCSAGYNGDGYHSCQGLNITWSTYSVYDSVAKIFLLGVTCNELLLFLFFGKTLTSVYQGHIHVICNPTASMLLVRTVDACQVIRRTNFTFVQVRILDQINSIIEPK